MRRFQKIFKKKIIDFQYRIEFGVNKTEFSQFYDCIKKKLINCVMIKGTMINYKNNIGFDFRKILKNL